MTKRWGLGYAMAENGEPNGIIQAAFSEGSMFETDENKTLKFLGEQNFKLPVSTQEQ